MGTGNEGGHEDKKMCRQVRNKNGREEGECTNEHEPRHSHLLPILLGHLRHPRVREDASVQKLHDVKGCADDRLILAEDVRLGDGDALGGRGGRLLVVLVQRVQDGVLALDLMRGLAEKLARRLLAEDSTLPAGHSESYVKGCKAMRGEVQRTRRL